METKILTLFIPTYNMENYLRQCLESLILAPDQMDKLEVLVINDGSRDDSSAIAHDYQDKYPETFRVIDKENGNYGSCINRGLKEARGKYVKILDADDHFYTKGFAEFLKYLSTIDVDLVLSNFITQGITGNCLKIKRYRLEPWRVLNFCDVCLDSSLENILMHGICYRRDLLLSMGYKQLEGISYTDVEWAFKPLTSVKTIYFINVFVYCYLLGRPGQTVSLKSYKKSARSLLIVARSNVEFLMGLNKKLNSSVRAYLEEELKYVLYLLYYYSIIFNGLSYSELLEFDQFLKASKMKIYDNIPSLKINFYRYPFVERWRHDPLNYKLPMIIRFILPIKISAKQFKYFRKNHFGNLEKNEWQS